VRIWKFCSRPNVGESPACAKPLGRYMPFALRNSAEKSVYFESFALLSAEIEQVN